MSAEQIGLIHASLGDNDEAMVWMEKAYEARSAFIVTGFSSPRYDPLRRDPTFTALLKKMRLAR